MDSTDEIKKPTKIKIEYDGYYRVDTISRDGNIAHIYCRGHKLKSWIQFEKSLSSTMSSDYQQVTETEYMEHHWSSFPMDPMDDETISVLIESCVAKQPKEFPEVVQISKIKKTTKKLATTDRNIGEVKEFVSKPVKKKGRKTEVNLEEFL